MMNYVTFRGEVYIITRSLKAGTKYFPTLSKVPTPKSDNYKYMTIDSAQKNYSTNNIISICGGDFNSLQFEKEL